MNNFCANCGTKLSPKSRFCPACGTPVSKSENEIRITEDGKGGLIFEVPEGSTVTISDQKPK